MQQLYTTGWIHHLQRHLVASVLTRPREHHGLAEHWMEGEAHFRDSLLDHDASVNRANFMWLAGVAFSSKARNPTYAYHEGTYITNRLKKCAKK